MVSGRTNGGGRCIVGEGDQQSLKRCHLSEIFFERVERIYVLRFLRAKIYRKRDIAVKLMARWEGGTVEKGGVFWAFLTSRHDLDDVAVPSGGRRKKPKRMSGVIHGDLRVDAPIGAVAPGL